MRSLAFWAVLNHDALSWSSSSSSSLLNQLKKFTSFTVLSKLRSSQRQNKPPYQVRMYSQEVPQPRRYSSSSSYSLIFEQKQPQRRQRIGTPTNPWSERRCRPRNSPTVGLERTAPIDIFLRNFHSSDGRLTYYTNNDPIRMEDFPPHLIRNFSIIAHIDHGKSTLADRLLEMTNTIPKKTSGSNQQVLDKLKVERERGITVKAQTASMKYQSEGQTFLLNLIDTPGHVDFAWEVSRSLQASEGAILLVDASQGIQAQTLSVYHSAMEKGLKIIPVLNKVDLPAAEPDRIAAQLVSAFGTDPKDILRISAKSGMGVEHVLAAIIRRIPAPQGQKETPLKALLFDSAYDRFRGVISLVRIHGGVLKKGDKIASCHTRKKYDVIDVGVRHPEETPTSTLQVGQVGYIACNMKDSSEAHIGDTFHRVGEPVEPFPGFQLAKAMVYAGVFPIDSNEFPKLEESIKRLMLTDRSVSMQRESSSALGQGCRLGFLGTLHMDVFQQRLEDEYDANVIITAPTVPYKIFYRDGTSKTISNPTDFPDYGDFKVVDVQEPFVRAKIIVPQDYLGNMLELCSEHRGEATEFRHLDPAAQTSRVLLEAKLPLAEVVTDFFDKLKGRSSGFASFDYEETGYESSELRKMVFLLNSKPVDALAMVIHRSKREAIARAWTKKLREVIPRQLFEVPIQAVCENKVIARETLSAVRKDVTAGLYGGHYERKLKHLNKQKEGKKKLKSVGKIDLPQEAFFSLLKKRA